MYTKNIPFKDLNDKPRNITLHFNLYEREVFKLLVEFQSIFSWRESLGGEQRDLSTAEVVEFYNNLEEILLSAYGVPSEDGLYFDKTDRYRFESSAMFNACMKLFVEDQTEANKLIDGLMPKGLQEMVKKADGSLAELAKDPKTEESLRAEIERLRAQLPKDVESN